MCLEPSSYPDESDNEDNSKTSKVKFRDVLTSVHSVIDFGDLNRPDDMDLTLDPDDYPLENPLNYDITTHLERELATLNTQLGNVFQQ